MDSYLNNTAAGRAALNTVAEYLSLIDTTPQLKTVTPLRLLSAPGCDSCSKDIANDSGIIEKGLTYSNAAGDYRLTTVALFIEYPSAGSITIQADVQYPAVQLVDVHHSVQQSSKAQLRTSDFVVRYDAGSARIQSLFDRPT